VPSAANPQSWNRYSYVQNNPIRFNDPTGHKCSPEDECSGSQYTAADRIDNWKRRIKKRFGINMSDEGQQIWSATNLSIVYSSLGKIDITLNGKLKSFVSGATFWLKNQNVADGQYHGSTHLDGSGINFYKLSGEALRQMNIFHEVGHLLDNVPGLKDVFTNAVDNESNPNWVTNGYVSQNALKGSQVADPYYQTTDAVQAYNPGPSEEWADAFANSVAGNINLASPEGRSMNSFVNAALNPYISDPTRYEGR
jgi:hypothetical protein